MNSLVRLPITGFSPEGLKGKDLSHLNIAFISNRGCVDFALSESYLLY